MSGEGLREISEKLEAVMRRLDYIEAIVTESKQYPEIAALLRDLRVGTALYGEPLKLLQRLISVQRYLSRSGDSRDPTSRVILNTLAVKGSMNVSQLTREAAAANGKASRVTVRKRIRELVGEGLVEKTEGAEYRFVTYPGTGKK